MSLAEVFERVAGPDAGVEFNAYDGSRAGQPGSPGVRVTVRDQIAVRYLAQAARRSRPGQGLRVRPSRRGRRHAHGAVQAGRRAADRPVPDRTARRAQSAGRAGPAAAQGRAAAAGGAGQPKLAGRAAALQAPRCERDLAPLRRLQHVLRVGARPVDGLHLRLLPAPGRHARAGTDAQVRPGGQEDRAEARDAAARRRLRLGRHGDARGPRVRRARARRDAVRAAGTVGAAGDQGGGRSRTWPRSATWTTGTSPRPISTRSARSG